MKDIAICFTPDNREPFEGRISEHNFRQLEELAVELGLSTEECAQRCFDEGLAHAAVGNHA